MFDPFDHSGGCVDSRNVLEPLKPISSGKECDFSSFVHGLSSVGRNQSRLGFAQGPRGHPYEEKPQIVDPIRGFSNKSDNVLLSHGQAIVPSPLRSLTAVFGMGTGGSSSP